MITFKIESGPDGFKVLLQVDYDAPGSKLIPLELNLSSEELTQLTQEAFKHIGDTLAGDIADELISDLCDEDGNEIPGLADCRDAIADITQRVLGDF